MLYEMKKIKIQSYHLIIKRKNPLAFSAGVLFPTYCHIAP